MKNNYQRSRKEKATVKSNYHFEIDVSEEIIEIDVAYIQSLIEFLQWIMESRCVDICCEIFIMSSFLVLPHEEKI